MGFNLENLSNSLLKMGSGLMQMGTFYVASKAINGGCGGGGMYGGSIFSSGGGYGGGCCNGGGGYGGYGYGMQDAAQTNFLMGQAYGDGYALAQQMDYMNPPQPSYNNFMFPGMNNTQQTLQKTNNAAAKTVEKDQDTALAETFEQNIKDKKGTQFVADSWKDMPNDQKKTDELMFATDNLAKSFIMHMDKTAGNSDGEIGFEEYQNYNIKTDLAKDVSEQDKTTAKKNSEIAFNKLDQNGDGKLDWMEMASMFRTYDANQDGNVAYNEVQNGNKSLLNPTSNDMDQKIRQSYDELYPPEQE